MSLDYNISSVFLLLPLFIQLNMIEICMIISIALVSFLYHTNREIDAKRGNYLQKHTKILYYVDRFQIQMGFSYIILRYLPLVYQLPLYFIISIMFENNIILGIIILLSIIKTALINPHNLIIIFIGSIIAAIGYYGMPLEKGEHKITVWSEYYKCMWHMGMAITTIGLLS
jgi:hypothetical protein